MEMISTTHYVLVLDVLVQDVLVQDVLVQDVLVQDVLVQDVLDQDVESYSLVCILVMHALSSALVG